MACLETVACLGRERCIPAGASVPGSRLLVVERSQCTLAVHSLELVGHIDLSKACEFTKMRSQG